MPLQGSEARLSQDCPPINNKAQLDGLGFRKKGCKTLLGSGHIAGLRSLLTVDNVELNLIAFLKALVAF